MTTALGAGVRAARRVLSGRLTDTPLAVAVLLYAARRRPLSSGTRACRDRRSTRPTGPSRRSSGRCGPTSTTWSSSGACRRTPCRRTGATCGATCSSSPRRASTTWPTWGRRRSRSSSCTCGRATPTTRRCRPGAPGGRWWRCGASTGSRCATGWSGPTRPPPYDRRRPAKRLPKALPVSDIERILEAAAAPGTALALRDRALLELLYGTGARISEAVGLDVDDLDLDTGTVLLRGKGSKERLVPFGSMAAEAVVGVPGAGAPVAVRRRVRATRRCSSTPAADGCPGRAPGRCWSGPPSGPASPPRSRRTRCGTRSPPTSSTAARTCGSSRSCSATRR